MIILKALFFCILVFWTTVIFGESDSWSTVLEQKQGEITFYWFPNDVQIENSKDIIDGVEHDLALAFVNYLNRKYDVEITLNWVKTSSFNNVLQNVATSRRGDFGASSISITDERRQFLNFTTPYLPDIVVLVSHYELPVAQTPDELKNILRNGVAITIPNTTLSESIDELIAYNDLEPRLRFVENGGQLIETIERTESGFGYVDLPNFLVSVRQNTEVKRQFFYPIKLEGLAIAYPKSSDWIKPVNDYFNSDQFEVDKQAIITKYLGDDVFQTIEQISKSAEIGPFEEIVLSHRERELQFKELLSASEEAKRKTAINNLLIIVLIAGGLLLCFIGVLYYVKLNANKQLTDKNEIISNALQERESLIREIHHRVKNNLQVISSLLKVQTRFISDNQAKIALKSTYGRVSAMALVHENMYRTDSVSHIYTDEYFRNLISSIHRTFNRKDIEFECEIDKVMILSEFAVKVGLMTNELLTNAYKHAFPPNFSGSKRITLCVEKLDDQLKIEITDTGIGLVTNDKTHSYGLTLIQSLIKSMKGSFDFATNGKTQCTLYIPVKNEA